MPSKLCLCTVKSQHPFSKRSRRYWPKRKWKCVPIPTPSISSQLSATSHSVPPATKTGLRSISISSSLSAPWTTSKTRLRMSKNVALIIATLSSLMTPRVLRNSLTKSIPRQFIGTHRRDSLMAPNLALARKLASAPTSCTRGPMALEELTTYKYVIRGTGQIRDAGLEAFALLRNRHLQFPQLATLLLHFAVFFEELVEQHRVHRLVAHGVHLPLGVASHQSGVHFFYLLGHQTKLRDALRVKVVFVAEGHRFERENRFAHLVHRLDLVLETLRGNCRAEVTAAIYNYPYTSGHTDPANAGDTRLRVSSYRAEADCVGLASNTAVADVNIVTARREILTSSCAQGDVALAGCVVLKRCETAGRVEAGV